MVLPCRGQERKWSEADKKQYFDILKQADKRIYLSEKYYDGCMLARNRHLVDNSGYCVAYLRKKQGGTSYTVKYAETRGLQIIKL